MSHDKTEALARLDGVHREIRAEHGLANSPFITAQQVHTARRSPLSMRWSAKQMFRELRRTDHKSARRLPRHLRRRLLRGLHRRSRTPCDWSGAFRKKRDGAWDRFQRHSNDDGAIWFQRVRSRYPAQPLYSPAALRDRFRGRHRPAMPRSWSRLRARWGRLHRLRFNAYYSYRAEKGRTGRMLAFLAFSGSRGPAGGVEVKAGGRTRFLSRFAPAFARLRRGKQRSGHRKKR